MWFITDLFLFLMNDKKNVNMLREISQSYYPDTLSQCTAVLLQFVCWPLLNPDTDIWSG